MGDLDDYLLPPGSRLLHIGPHKTGTSALQGAMHQARPAMRAHGVHMAGKGARPTRATWAVTGGSGPIGAPAAGIEHWERLVREIDAAGDQRVVISNESFSLAREEPIQQIVKDLGPDRIHVVAMLRRLDKILPSQWQQGIADGGHRWSYERWLRKVFEGMDAFWRRHGYGEVTQRWADGVGAENMTVVVVDETDRNQNLRLFEAFLGLPVDTLQLVENRANRSLTYGEVEMLRVFNGEFRNQGWAPEVQPFFVRSAAIPTLKERRPDPDEQRISTPAWALERAAEAVERGIEAVRASGVRVIGDLSSLVQDTNDLPSDAASAPPKRVGPRIPALAVSGVVDAATTRKPFGDLFGNSSAEEVPPDPADPEQRLVDDVSTRTLVEVLRRRVLGGVRPNDPAGEAHDG